MRARLLLLRLLIFSLANLLLSATPTLAFKPDWTGHSHFTDEALRRVTLSCDGDIFNFSDSARREIIDANESTDKGPLFVVSKHHFDNELLADGNKVLIDTKDEIIRLVTVSSNRLYASLARIQLGHALHTLQDYYSHSNWVELQSLRGIPYGIDTRLGRREQPPFIALHESQRTAHPDTRDVLWEYGLTHLTTGYFALPEPCFFGPSHKIRHGNDLVTICGGLNKDTDSAPGGIPLESLHGVASTLAVDASVDYISQILEDPRLISDCDAKKSLLDVSIRQTLAFVIDNSGSMNGLPIDQFGRYVGNQSRLNIVKSSVKDLVLNARNRAWEPLNYLLVTFSDPIERVSKPLIFNDPEDFLREVENIQATPSDGGDCPELLNTALLRAIADSPKDTTIYYVTDASAKDVELRPSVSAAARNKRIKFNPFSFFPAGCGGETTLSRGSITSGANTSAQRGVPTNLAFGSPGTETIQPLLLGETGWPGVGIVMTRKSDMVGAFDLIPPSLMGDFASLFYASGTLLSDAREFSIPVDSSVNNVVFSVTLSSGRPPFLGLLRPSGRPVLLNDPDVIIRELTFATIFTVKAPEPGVWRLRIRGTGEFTVEASGNTSLQFAGFEFVTLSGRRGHEGLAPIAGQPTSASTGRADLSGAVGTPSFILIDESSFSIQVLSLQRNSPPGALPEFVGSFGLPGYPFRVAVQGRDSSGFVYQRIFPTLFRAQSVELTVGDVIPGLVVGATNRISFVVQNVGKGAEFLVVVADSQGFIEPVQRTVVGLGTDEMISIPVDVDVPAGTPAGTSVSISATATKTTNRSFGNAATLDLMTLPADITPPTVRGWATPSVLSPPDGRLVEVAVSGTISDDLSGIASGSLRYRVRDESGRVQPAGSGTAEVDGTFSLMVPLEAELREPLSDGRRYTIYVEAEDRAGNLGEGLIRVPVVLSCADDENPRPFEVGNQLAVTRGGFRYNRATRLFTQTVTIQSTGDTTIRAPVYWVMDHLSSNVSVHNATGATTCAVPSGSPYVAVDVGSDGVLGSGESANLVLQFFNLNDRAITYTSRVLAGPGSP